MRCCLTPKAAALLDGVPKEREASRSAGWSAKEERSLQMSVEKKWENQGSLYYGGDGGKHSDEIAPPRAMSHIGESEELDWTRSFPTSLRFRSFFLGGLAPREAFSFRSRSGGVQVTRNMHAFVLSSMNRKTLCIHTPTSEGKGALRYFPQALSRRYVKHGRLAQNHLFMNHGCLGSN